MPEQNHPLPRLEALFFDVCKTAIECTSWKYADFEKVKIVEGQIAALHSFYVDYYAKEIEAAKAAEAAPTPPAEVMSTDPGVSSSPMQAAPVPEPVTANAFKSAAEPEPVAPVVTTEVANPTPEAPVAPEQKKNLITPAEVKAMPARPMPNDILDLVQIGIEVAKTTPKRKDVVEAKEIPAATSPEEIERNKIRFHNTANDINDALAPGEHYLTEEEAKERRQQLKEKREAAGLGVFD